MTKIKAELFVEFELCYIFTFTTTIEVFVIIFYLVIYPLTCLLI